MFIKSYNQDGNEYRLDPSAIICLHKQRDVDNNYSLVAHLTCLSHPITLLLATSEQAVDKMIGDISKAKDELHRS